MSVFTKTKMFVFSSVYTSLHGPAEIIGGNIRKKNIKNEQEKWIGLEEV